LNLLGFSKDLNANKKHIRIISEKKQKFFSDYSNELFSFAAPKIKAIKSNL